MTYGTVIKQAREELHLTQEQLAEELDISRQAVSKWEADLSRPTREKLDRLSQILDIPPETWAEIDAELEAASRPPDTSRPWKIAAAALAAACVLLAVILTAVLWPRPEGPGEDALPPAGLPIPGDTSSIFPETLPLTVLHDYDFGSGPLGDYDPSLIPFLDDWETVIENELWCGWFPDGTRLSVVKAQPWFDPNADFYDVYLLYAPPAGEDGRLDFQILYGLASEYYEVYYGAIPPAESFTNVLGYDGFKITICMPSSGLYSYYLSQSPDGAPCLLTVTSGDTRGELFSSSLEADVDGDGVLEIVSYNRLFSYWEITDTTEGEEGAFVYTLAPHSEGFPLVPDVTFSPDRNGFIMTDTYGVAIALYILRDGEMVLDSLPGPDRTDRSAIYPDTLPLTVRRDFDFGDQPLGEYDPALVPFLDDLEELQENELQGFMFGDAANHGPGNSWCHLSIVKTNTRTDERGTAFSDVYLLYAVPDEAGDLNYKILFRMAEENHYVNTDPGAVTVEPFFNVLGHDGFKVLITVGASGRWGFYLTQRPDGTPAMMTTTTGASQEADVDEDGELEIIDMWKNNPTWEITDTIDGEEGAFVYTLSTRSEDFPGALNLSFDPEKGGFVVLSSSDFVLARYVLRDGEMVRVPLTDFSVLDYPDVAGTEIIFVTDPGAAGSLTDGIDPDEILTYSEDVSITHRQQAYLALQELYNLTGLKVDSCYCAADEYGVLFSLLPDGFNQRSFLHFDFDTRCGNADNIPSIYISWKELGNDWSPLSLADAARPGSWVKSEAETILWYYNRMKIFSAGNASYANGGELWLENGDLYLCHMAETDSGPVLTGLTGPYPDGEVNH